MMKMAPAVYSRTSSYISKNNKNKRLTIIPFIRIPVKMPHIHKVKRLHHPYRHNEHVIIKNLPSNIINEDFLNRKYIKYFDYPLAELLTDHSTNPLQNTSRQCFDTLTNIPSKGRFVNHEMIIRRNGETTILRPRQDLVLANGFTPVIRPSSILPSYHSIISHSSLSIMNKMSMKKCEQTSIIKSKRKDRYHRKRSHQINNHSNSNFEYNNQQESNVIHFIQQALHEIIDQRTPQPVPLMSILPQFHSPHNQSFPPRLEESNFNRNPSYFNEQSFIPPLIPIPTNRCPEPFYDCPPKPHQNFEGNHQSYFNSPPSEHFHSSNSHPRNYTHMSGYFLDGN